MKCNLNSTRSVYHQALFFIWFSLTFSRCVSCSGRLMEAAASGVARWADTYLMPSKAASAGLVSAFGLQGGGPAVLQALVQVANISLSQ